MNASGGTIATRTAAHLVELDSAKRHVIQDNMANIRQVDAFAKGGSGDDAGKLTASKSILDTHAVAS